MMDKLHWYAGIHLAPSSVGALRFARWLHTTAPDHYALHGVYCVSPLHVVQPSTVAAAPDVTRHRLTLARFVERFECDDVFQTLEAIVGDADAVLRAMIDQRGGHAIVVGRSAGRHESAIVSLGAVPRRLIRKATVPVIVVPPDVPTDQLGGGPVVAAVTPDADSAAALRFAQDFARRHDLDLRLVHVVPQVSGADLDGNADAAEARRRLHAWCRERELADPSLAIVGGRVANAIIEHAQHQDASLIVCGSRRLSLVERLISSSQGSQVAAHADRSVAIVPPS